MSESDQLPTREEAAQAILHIGAIVRAYGYAEIRIGANNMATAYHASGVVELANAAMQYGVLRGKAERLQAELEQLRAAAQAVCSEMEDLGIATSLLLDLEAVLKEGNDEQR